MFWEQTSLFLNCFTFGARPRYLFYAVVLEGTTLTGLLVFKPNWLLDTTVLPNYKLLFSVLGLLAVVSTIAVSFRIARETYSPILHGRLSPLLVALGYLLIGGVVTLLGFLSSIYFFHAPVSLTPSEVQIGLSISLIYGFLILMYYDRFEIETPNNQNEVEEKAQKLLEINEELSNSSQNPINLTGRYEDFSDAACEIVKATKTATTQDGNRLAQDTEQWLEEFDSYREPGKGMIAGPSETPKRSGPKQQREDLESITKRLERIIDNE